MHFLLVFPVMLALGVTSVAAAPLDVTSIAQQMQAALAPIRPNTQKLTISVHDRLGEFTQFIAYQAHKKVWNEDWRLIVMQAPENVRGISYLVQEKVGKPDLQWVYLPALRRVRELMPIGAYQDFLGTDFTYGDLGLVDLGDRKYKLLGMEKHAGVWAYKVQGVPRQPWYYSRIVTWIAPDSFLPLQRDYYAPSKKLWKIERFEEIKHIDGVPTPLWITREDLQEGSRSTIAVSDVRYDTDIPDALFDPDQLSEALAAPVWRTTSIARAEQAATP